MSVPLKYRIRSAFLRGLAVFSIFLVRLFPPRLAFAFARGMSRLACSLQPRLLGDAIVNLKIAYGDTLSDDERRALARKSMENLAYTTVEFMIMGKQDADFVRRMCVEERGGGIEAVKKHLEKGLGIIGLGMHLGNWEFSGAYVSINGLAMHAVGKEQRDDFFTNLAFPWRERHGIINITRQAKLDTKIVRALRTNGVLGLISDQNGGHDGVFAPFFGVEASNVAGPAALHLKFRSPLVPIVAWRVSPGKLVFDVRPEIDTSDILADLDAETPKMTGDERIREICARVNRVYEGLIREHPEQWLWIHRRFKTRPDGEKGFY